MGWLGLIDDFICTKPGQRLREGNQSATAQLLLGEEPTHLSYPAPKLSAPE